MLRYTEKIDGEIRVLEDLNTGGGQAIPRGALLRLYRLEELIIELEATQEELKLALSALRSEGKTSSARFRELMGKKLVNANILSVLKAKGIYE